MTTSPGWFEVDKEGLAKVLKRKGMQFVLNELFQNVCDSGASKFTMTIEPVAGQPLAVLNVEDDAPGGFKDLSHAYRLFAESEKKSDPTKRGRFNLGEKLVLAVCRNARITSTSGSIIFESDRNGFTRRTSKECTKDGSVFHATIRMTRDELAEVLAAADLLITPIEAHVNGKRIEPRTPIQTFEATLPTEVADEEGQLKRTTRKTEIRVYEPFNGPARIYEMGIPVVECDLPWTIEIMQKVPLNSDRDNVTPAYSRELGLLVVNAMHASLRPDQAAMPAVQEALADERILPEAIDTVLTHTFGEKRAIFDGTDLPAVHRLQAQGYNIIPPGAFPKGVIRNIRERGGATTTRLLSPSYNPYSDSPDAPPRKLIPDEDWTKGMANIAQYAIELARKTVGISLTVHFEAGRMVAPWAANFGGSSLTFNYARLGKAYFEAGVTEGLNDLLIHEFAHHSGDHLTEAFDDAMSRIGAKMVSIALAEPEFFRKYGAK
jgi:hypothetical protein